MNRFLKFFFFFFSKVTSIKLILHSIIILTHLTLLINFYKNPFISLFIHLGSVGDLLEKWNDYHNKICLLPKISKWSLSPFPSPMRPIKGPRCVRWHMLLHFSLSVEAYISKRRTRQLRHQRGLSCFHTKHAKNASCSQRWAFNYAAAID